jgi:polar amino acid transport system substrate-binding protein
VKSRLALGMTAAMLCFALGACASISDDATKTSSTAVDPPPIPTTVPPTATTRVPPCTETPTQPDPRALQSFAPNGTSSDASQLTDPIIATIRKRGFVKVGVDENTRDFSALDPITGKITGLEIDIASEIAGPIAQAVLGDPSKIQLITVTTDQKVSYAAEGKVDFTISAVSMTCSRWGLVDFSSEYYTAQHKLLVRAGPDSPKSLQALAGRKVCVTRKSSSIDILKAKAPSANVVEQAARTDCLRELQRGTVDAYFSHDSILRGMQQQDPNMEIVGESVAPQHYGIAVAKDHPEFVRYINAVLERMRNDDTSHGLAAIYSNWLQDAAPPIPPARYRDAA